MILFVDYDGVLHPDAVFRENGRPVLRSEGSLFMWSGYLEEALEPHPDVEIVISSSWCRVLGFNRARKFLPMSLQRRVIGGTWHSSLERRTIGGFKVPLTWWDKATRYQQIMRYVRTKRVERWLAIDDDDEGWALIDIKRLILTDSHLGISAPGVLSQLAARLAER